MLIGQCTTTADIKKREDYWQRYLKTLFQNSLNERGKSCL